MTGDDLNKTNWKKRISTEDTDILKSQACAKKIENSGSSRRKK